MELIEGESLREHWPTDLDEITTIARPLCAALDHAHANGVIHRDLKPENRPASAGEVLESLRRLETQGEPFGSFYWLPLLDCIVRDRPAGRERELRDVRGLCN